MPEFISKLEDFEKKDLSSFKTSKDMFSFACEHVSKFRNSILESCLARMKEPLTQDKFLREYLWCVYVSGFSAKTISAKYDALLSAHRIKEPITILNTPASLDNVFAVFKNKAKANAIQEVRKKILSLGWESFKTEYVNPQVPEIFERLPNIGPALSIHLARNLGNLDLVKPDVHLKRISAHYGHSSVREMCKSISDECLAKTDLILWLASVDHGTK